jgi:hypothetical protein
MQPSPYLKAGLVALTLVVGFVIAWEIFLRSEGYRLSYNDDEALWASHRQRIYDASDAGPVIIGSSRVKFGIDLSTWEAATGAAPVQLAQVGTSPRPVLADMARDEKFKGTLLVGITEGLFFAPSGSFPEQQARKCVAFYPTWSLAQQAGFRVGQALESRLLFLDEDLFSLRNLMKRMRVPDRPGVFAIPPFPMKFVTSDLQRQTFITPEFLADTAMQNEQRANWMYIFTKAPKMPMPDSVLDGIFRETGADVAKIRARGGKVVFVRMPTTGDVWELEKQAFPRQKYWDRLLSESGAPGIHFSDYPELSKYQCPEWSHLSPADAGTFTADLIRIIEQKTGTPIRKAHLNQSQSTLSSLTSR